MAAEVEESQESGSGNRPVLWKPNRGAQTEFLTRLEDELLYGGAKGGGKSEAIVIEPLRQIDKAGYKGLLIRRTYPRLEELTARAKDLYPAVGGKWVDKHQRFEFLTSDTSSTIRRHAFIRFGHCQHEEDKRNYQGHEYQFIGFDQLEEFTESQYLFLMAQNRSSIEQLKCYIRGTANPGGPGHWWVKRRFIDGKTPRETYENEYTLYDNRILSRTSSYIPATVRDNPKVNPQYIATLMQLPERDRQALMEGDWGAYDGGSVFDKQGMRMQQSRIMDPQWVGYLKDMGEYIQLVNDPNGNLKVFLEPRDDNEYVVGGDISEGVEGGDYSSAHVVDKRTWEVVAVWHGHIDPTKFGEVLARLGAFYNQAEIASEINNTMGGTVMAKLKAIKYSPLYRRAPDKYGWETNTRTRGDMLGTLMDAVLNGSVKVRDQETLDEMRSFHRNPENGKLEAMEGSHDDRIMSLAIALQVIRVNPFRDARFDRSESGSVVSLLKTPKRRRGLRGGG